MMTMITLMESPAQRVRHKCIINAYIYKIYTIYLHIFKCK